MFQRALWGASKRLKEALEKKKKKDGSVLIHLKMTDSLCFTSLLYSSEGNLLLRYGGFCTKPKIVIFSSSYCLSVFSLFLYEILSTERHS